MEQQPAIEISPEFLEANPLVQIAFVAFPLLVMAFLTGTISSWVFLFIRVKQGKPLLAPEPWRPRVWGFVDILLAATFILFWQFQSSVFGDNVLGVVRQEAAGAKTIPLSLAAILSLGNVAALITICGWIVLRHRASLAQLGFSFKSWPRHVAIGVIAALASIPLVYALMAAVNIGFNNQYSHPLLEELKRDGSLPAYLLAVTSAVLIAPLTEEFFFRVIIQGWLQSAPFGSIRSIFLGQREDQQLAQIAAPGVFVTSPVLDNPYAPSGVLVTASKLTDATTENSTLIPPIWPSLVTGVLFGLAHFSYGLSFIPLIVLGTILGLLYRATHSIWPSLVVHFMLNGSSMLALGFTILVERATSVS